MSGTPGFDRPPISLGRRVPLRLAGGIAALSFVAGCDMPAGMNTDCAWPTAFLSAPGRAPMAEADAVAHPRRLTDRRQLQFEIRVAEELAMRYADARGKLARDYLGRRNGCESKLLEQLASHQKLTGSEISDARS